MNWARAAMAISLLVPLAFAGFSAATVADRPDWSLNQSVIVGVQGPGDQGKVVAYGPDGNEQWRVERAASYHDVSKLDSGNVLVTYVVGTDDCEQYQPPCGETGLRILEPDPAAGTAHIADEWSFEVRTVGNSEVHDAEPLPNGRYLTVDMDRERVMSVNITTGDVRHIWNASQHYDLPADPTKTDWLHMNDVDRLPDGRIMVSVRNQNEVVLLENGSVDEVINAGGDPTVIRGQHNPQWLGNGSVLIGDSSNDRVVELHRQPNGTWTPTWSSTAANSLPFSWPRDADRLANGHTLITDSRNNRLVEVDESGEVVGILQTPALPYEADVVAGEQRQAPAQDPTAVNPGTGEGHLPVIGTLWIGVQHMVPMPYWLTEWHLLAAVPGLLGVLLFFGLELVEFVITIGSVVQSQRRSTDDTTEADSL